MNLTFSRLKARSHYAIFSSPIFDQHFINVLQQKIAGVNGRKNIGAIFDKHSANIEMSSAMSNFSQILWNETARNRLKCIFLVLRALAANVLSLSFSSKIYCNFVAQCERKIRAIFLFMNVGQMLVKKKLQCERGLKQYPIFEKDVCYCFSLLVS